MLLARPAILQNLLARYEAVQALYAERGTREARQRMDDVAYTLCVSTGTSDIDTALRAAERQLTAAHAADRARTWSTRRPRARVSGA
ncbi:DUF5133 domain-containing protein [Streptomyces oceani]|uniref:Methionine ABC transporter ATP-binding protein n=1 Tax=Streptomyces oceani TaxID=1075402 RepID=A0A1E7KKX8_9ACTN|nr:DUF5133 domain-containing protein [Streptomyces oceani]OEV04540.1 hypothetical protein AN216_06420 [Streptomyces oceani]